ncbi:WD40 repeat domain-containing protein [Candidatus Odyssella acanthamoebae]|uniref:Uncharacterized protein n=1 Tax=Candidatus Odyssella acanthamoebae TaxID=91604 RepID=A0A077ATV0_9PROT|nr:WD40 repeat domain-containing protein [Candidatus Paracaedibacter acanthamoebae]AIK96622.1 hypothetical protein ID47_07665 [Candidatus Paracaedibacter acanthamoebae]
MRFIPYTFATLYFITIPSFVSAMDNPHLQAERHQSYKYHSSLRELPLLFPDDICVLSEKEGKSVLDIYQKGQPFISLPMDLSNITDIQLSLDGTLYVLGRDRQGKSGILTIREEGASKLTTYGLGDIRSMQLSPDNTLYLLGRTRQGKVSIVTVKEGTISQPTSYGLKHVQEIHLGPEGILYLWGEDQQDKMSLITVIGGKVSQPIPYRLISICSIQQSADGILYLLGLYQDNKMVIVNVKEGAASQPATFGLRSITDMQLSPDGALYLLGEDQQDNKMIIVSVRQGVVSQLITYELNELGSMQLSSDGTLYLWGRDREDKGSIVSVREGVASQPATFGLRSMWSMQLSSDGTLYLLGKDHQDKLVIVHLREGTVFQRIGYELRGIQGMQSGFDGTLYVVGFDKQDKKNVVVLKGDTILGVNNVIELASVRGEHVTIKSILASTIRDIFLASSPNENGINIPLFERLCQYLKKFPCSRIGEKDGMELHDSILSHFHIIKKDDKATFLLWETLEYLINVEDERNIYHPLRPYASAIAFMYYDPQDYFIQQNGFSPFNIQEIKQELGEQKYQEKYKNTQNIASLLTIIQHSRLVDELKKLYGPFYSWVQLALKQLGSKIP